MTGVAIRQGRASDLERIQLIEASAAETFERYGQPLPDGSPPVPIGYWRAAVDQGLLWVAEESGEVLGFLAAQVAGEALHVDEVDVLPDRQRRGLGAALIAAAAAGARERGLSEVTLTTFRTIPWNGPFYARLGFEAVEPPEAVPRLAQILAGEARRGFSDRCAMRLAL